MTSKHLYVVHTHTRDAYRKISIGYILSAKVRKRSESVKDNPQKMFCTRASSDFHRDREKRDGEKRRVQREIQQPLVPGFIPVRGA